MNTKKFSEAMDELDDKYINEAIQYQRAKQKHNWFLKGAIAACLCLCIAIGWLVYDPSSDFVSVPGLFTITAYALSPSEELSFMEEYEMVQGIEMPVEYGWSQEVSCVPGLPFKLSMADWPNATFDISVDGGHFVLWVDDKIIPMDSTFSVNNDTNIYWVDYLDETETESHVGTYAANKVYADMVVRDGDNIIGYAVIKIYTHDPEDQHVRTFGAVLLQSVSFPLVNSEYQNVTEEYVKSQIEQIKLAD